MHIILVNVNPNADVEVTCAARGLKVNSVDGEIITAKEIASYNTFENQNDVV
ncbi:MAG: hypothetical protein V1720_17185 [bacterium]